jgi:hypothetical protein
MPTIAELEARAEILARRLEEAERERTKAEKRADQLEVRAMQAETSAENALVESHLRAAALEAGSTAEPTEGSEKGPLDDAVRRAMIDDAWKIDSQGKPYRLLQNGDYDYTPPATVMKKLREKIPPYFPKHQGNGVTEATGTAIPAGTVNYWSKQHWNRTKQSEYQIQNGTDAADAMATAAGSSLYAIHPPAE